MSRPFSVLGLDADADERAIKRAYAAKLKTVRPDEDPEGFQRLNEAYRAALRWAQSRVAQENGSAAGAVAAAPAIVVPAAQEDAATPAPASAPSPADATPSQPRDLRLRDIGPPQEAEEPPQRFLHACLTVAANARRPELEAWLLAQPALWSLSRKAAMGRDLVRLLHTQFPPIPDTNFAAIAGFFAIDDLHSGYDPLFVDRLRQALHAAWVAAHGIGEGAPIEIPADRDGWPVYGVARTEDAQAELASRRRERAIRHLIETRHPELLGRTSWWKLAAGVLFSPRVTEISKALESLGSDADARFDAKALRFWRGAKNVYRLSRGSAFLVFTRSLAIGLVFSTILLSIAMFSKQAPMDAGFAIAIPAIAIAIALLTSLGWLLLVLGLAFVAWQEQPDPPPGIARRWHRMTIPLLVALGLVPFATSVSDALGLPVLALAAITAWCRQATRHRAPRLLDDRDGNAFWVLLRVVLGLVVVGLSGQITTSDHALLILCLSLAAAAMALWALDLVRQRRRRVR